MRKMATEDRRWRSSAASLWLWAVLSLLFGLGAGKCMLPKKSKRGRSSCNCGRDRISGAASLLLHWQQHLMLPRICSGLLVGSLLAFWSPKGPSSLHFYLLAPSSFQAALFSKLISSLTVLIFREIQLSLSPASKVLAQSPPLLCTPSLSPRPMPLFHVLT